MTTKRKKTKFADKGKKILKGQKPKDLSSFLDDNEKNTDNRKTVKTESRTKNNKTKKTVREEFRLPFKLAEKLRSYAYKKRTTKVAVVKEALEQFFSK